MDHREKVDRLIEDLTRRGAWKSNVAPPLWQLLWKLGVNVRPPLFMGFLGLLSTIGIVAGALYAVIMAELRGEETSLGQVVLVGAVFAVVFSAVYARLMARMRTKYDLPSWDAYPNDDEGA